MTAKPFASYVAGSALVGLIVFAKEKGFTREQFVELCGKAWDRYEQGAHRVREFFDVQVRNATRQR